MADFWGTFGLTPLTIWELTLADFLAMTVVVDRLRREAQNHNGN